MQDAASYSSGEYVALPIAEEGRDGQWKAGLCISLGQPRGDRPAKSLFPHPFPSRDAALRFAHYQCRSFWGGGASAAASSMGNPGA